MGKALVIIGADFSKNAIDGTVNVLQPLKTIHGWWRSSPVEMQTSSASNYFSQIFSVSAGQNLHIKVTQDQTSGAAAFVATCIDSATSDAPNHTTSLMQGTSGETSYEFDVTIPSGETVLAVSAKASAEGAYTIEVSEN